MPTYRVKPGYRFGAGSQYGPGDTVKLTDHEAAGFLDKLELVKKKPVQGQVDAPKTISVSNQTVSELKVWLESGPDNRDVEMALGLEQAGKQRQTAIELFTEYIEGVGDEHTDD